MLSYGDVIDRGVISLELADTLINIHARDLMKFCPAVVFPAGTIASELRRSKPVLCLSVIAAASIVVDAGVAAVLNREMIQLYADQLFIQAEKSLELIQALLLMTVFYYPPDSPSKLQHYQYINIAATMALEIGLALKCRVSENSRATGAEDGVYDGYMAEQARALLGCYHLAST